MSAVKKVCINSSKNYYMGTELSPLHYGLSAEGYDINSIMEGYDKELWIVDVKNNKKVWVKNDHLSRITHEEPVIKNILSLYNNAEEIEKINQLKQKCGKDGSYNLKDIKKLYNLCDDYDCENEADENNNEAYCKDGSGGDASLSNNEGKEGNACISSAITTATTSTTTSTDKAAIASTDTVINDFAESGTKGVVKATKTGAKAGAKSAKVDNVCDDGNYTLKEDKGGKCRKGAVAGTAGTAGTAGAAAKKEHNDGASGDDKKPTDYNIFVKFRLNELKEISTNKKDNFENVKIEWRELKKNKTELKIVMDKAYLWLNSGK